MFSVIHTSPDEPFASGSHLHPVTFAAGVAQCMSKQFQDICSASLKTLNAWYVIVTARPLLIRIMVRELLYTGDSGLISEVIILCDLSYVWWHCWESSLFNLSPLVLESEPSLNSCIQVLFPYCPTAFWILQQTPGRCVGFVCPNVYLLPESELQGFGNWLVHCSIRLLKESLLYLRVECTGSSHSGG